MGVPAYPSERNGSFGGIKNRTERTFYTNSIVLSSHLRHFPGLGDQPVDQPCMQHVLSRRVSSSLRRRQQTCMEPFD